MAPKRCLAGLALATVLCATVASQLLPRSSPLLLKRYRMNRMRTAQKIKAMVESVENQVLLRQQRRIQEKVSDQIPFPCPLNNSRSYVKPTSVHQLRPGDIDVVGAMGDSLSAGVGLTATKIRQVYYNNRQMAGTAGGASTWREFITIPNILKEFNPNLTGYAIQASSTRDKESRFNVADTGAMSQDLPHMAKLITRRIRSDPEVNFYEDWKLVSVYIGANDFCIEVCYQRSYEKVLDQHRKDLVQALRYLRDNLPRVLINLIVAPNLELLTTLEDKPRECQTNHLLVCPCLFGLPFSPRRNETMELMRRWQQVDLDVAYLKEFDRDDFTVVVQTFGKIADIPKNPDGSTDYSYFSADCFHLSQKACAGLVSELWKDMLTPVGKKTVKATYQIQDIACPSAEHPYIFTRRNSNL